MTNQAKPNETKRGNIVNHIVSATNKLPLPASLYGKVFFIAAHVLFLLVTSYKLTHASLWYDEAIEWRISIMNGKEMYENIIKTFQPPLYNWLMHIWLNIHFGETWFRLSSVLFGFLGCLGLYFAINKLIGWKSACLSIFFYTFLRWSIYYNQECAEYALVIACLFWVVYFGVLLLKKFSIKASVGYAICCTLAMYSQYGAIFTIIGLSLIILYRYLREKKFNALIKVSTVMGSAALIFGVPLYLFFLRIQRGAIRIAKPVPYANPFEEIKLFLNRLLDNYAAWFNLFFQNKIVLSFTEIVLLLLATILIYSAFQQKNKTVRYIAYSAIASYLANYAMVRLGLYGIAVRYIMPLLPIVLVSGIFSLYTTLSNSICLNRKSRTVAFCGLTCLLLIHNIYSWGTIKNNWTKENTREATRLYFDETQGKEHLYLSHPATPGFAFYAKLFGYDYGIDALSTSNRSIWATEINHAAAQYGNFHYAENLRNRDSNYVKKSMSLSFSNTMPDKLWFMLSHITRDTPPFHDVFYDFGYSYQIYRWNDARLLKLYNETGINGEYNKIFDSGGNAAAIINEGNNVSFSYNQHQTIIEATGKDPHTFFTFSNVMYNKDKPHLLMLDFNSRFSGNIQVFYIAENRNFDNHHAVDAQYLSNNTRILIPIPPHVSLENIRVDFNNSNIPRGQKSVVMVSEVKIFEAP